MRDLVACLCPKRILLEQEVDVEVILRTCRTLVLCGHGVWDGNCLGLLRRYIRFFIRQSPFVNDFAVLQKLPLDFIIVDIGEVILIIDVDLAVYERIFRCRYPNGLVLILHFIELRLRVAVRRYEAVHAEVAAVVAIAKVAAVAKELAVHLFIVEILLCIILCIVIPILALQLGNRLGVIQPQHNAVVGCADGRCLAVLCLEFFRRQCLVINARNGDFSIHCAIVLQIDADAEVIRIGANIETTVVGRHQLAIIVDLQSASVVGACDLMPVAHPIAREIKGSRAPAAIIDEEFHTRSAAAAGLQSNLRIALCKEYTVHRSRVRLHHDFKGEVCILSGEDLVINVICFAGNDCITAVGLAGEGSIVRVVCAGRSSQRCSRRVVAQFRDAALARQGIKIDVTGLIDPVPNESAKHVIRAADCIPIFFDIADCVAHCVVIFAHDIGHLAFASISLYGADRGIHVAAHIGAAVLVQTFRMNRAGQIAVLEEPHCAREDIVAAVAVIAHLVADGPCHNRCLILQRLIGRVLAVKQDRIQIVINVVVLAHDRVTFRICLAHHIQAILVAEVIEVFVVRIVRGTDRVEVPCLHHLDVFLIDFLRHIFASERIGIVAVSAAEQQRLAVDGDRLIFRCDPVVVFIYFRAGELDLTEAKLLRNALKQLAGSLVVKVEDQRIEVRVLCAPELRALDQLADVRRCGFACGDCAEVDVHGVVCKDVVALCIKQLNVDGKVRDILRRIVGDHRAQLEVCVRIGLVQVGNHAIVRDMHQRGGIEIDVAEDTAVIDHVLVFHPRAVAEFMYFNSEGVDFALRVQVIGDIKLVRTVAVLTVAHLMSVDIDIISGFHALEGNQHTAVFLKHGRIYGEFLAVETHRVIIGRRLRHTGIIPFLPGHLGIRIDGIVPIAAVLIAGPAARDVYVVPTILGFYLVVGVHKALVQILLGLFRIGHDHELPIFLAGTGKHLDVCGLILRIIHCADHGLVHGFIRNRGCRCGFAVDPHNVPGVFLLAV